MRIEICQSYEALSLKAKEIVNLRVRAVQGTYALCRHWGLSYPDV